MQFQHRAVFHPEDISAEWLTHIFGDQGAVIDFEIQTIGTGQVGANFRCHLTWDGHEGPSTVVIKFAALDAQSRATGIEMGTYRREVEFYRQIAPRIDVAVPYVHYLDFVPGSADVVIVMEDLHPRIQGDQLNGCSYGEAEAVLSEAALLHSAFWGDESLSELDWVSRRRPDEIAQTIEFIEALQPAFTDRYRSSLSDQAIEAADRFAQGAFNWFSKIPAPSTLVHGDYRLDNLMFAPDGSAEPRSVVVVDWQTVTHSHAAHDVAYFLGSCFEPKERRRNEEQLVAHYLNELADSDATVPITLDELWLNYRRFSWSGFLMAMLASMIVGRTERGDAMFVAMANRHAAQIFDLDAIEFVNRAA
ncbi:MAG: phosphotransferase [Actinomycetota bacterium]|nr:phosphotransferase [Actinomycetota bacterium]